MMGLGYLGNGGSSSSSSNLSASAPPFTVDQSNPKPNSNPLRHFTEQPYAVPFQSSFQNWQYSPASRPDLCPNLDSNVDSIRTSFLPSANDYQYFGSHSVSSPGTCIGNHVEANPYCPPFASPVVDSISSVALNEPNFDLLSVSHVGSLDGTSQIDYTQNLAGLEYMPQWGSFWKLADEDPSKGVDLNQSFCSEETKDTGSNVYKNYIKQAVCTAEGSSKCDGASAVSGKKCVDVLGRESSSTGKLIDKSFSLRDPRLISSESATSISRLNSTFLESHAQVPFLGSTTNFWNHPNPYSGPYDKCFQSPDSCTNNRISVKKSSPALVIRPPSTGTSSTMPNTVSSENVNSIYNVAAINSKDFGFHNPSNQKEPLLPLSDDKEGCFDASRPSLLVERKDNVFIASSSTRNEELSNLKEGLDHIPKAGIEFRHLGVNVPDHFSLSLDRAKGFSSVGDSSESLDHYNPAVDSPCWKGAPNSRFSPSEVSEDVTPQHLMKKLDACNSLNPQQIQIPSCSDDNVKVFCQNLFGNSMNQGNGYVELGSLLCPEKLSKDHSLDETVKAGFHCPKSSSSSGVQFSHDIDKPGKEYEVPNDSKSDSILKSSHAKQPSLDKGAFISDREFKISADVANTGFNTHDATDDCSVLFHGVESISCLPSSAEDVNKLVKLHATASTPKMNVQMLVNTIHNLSELLLFHSSNDALAVSEQDLEALKHVINNIDACVSKKILHTSPTQESMFTKQGASQECSNVPDLQKGVNVGRPLVTKETGAGSHGLSDHHRIHEGKRNGNVSGKEIEKFPDCVSLRGDADIEKDDVRIQAIKKVLEKEFDGGEELQSETLLFKNLWLEAEAALCSISFRARFNRMKIEMDKCMAHKAKDVAESSKGVEKSLNSEVYPDPKTPHKATPEAKDSPMSDNYTQDSPISSTIKVSDDVEPSILARFHILKRRDENSNSVSAVGQRLAEVLDAGFTGKRDHWPFIEGQSEGGSADIAVGPYSQYYSSKFGSYIGGSDHETVKEFSLCASDDQAIQSYWKNKLGNQQLLSGWGDSSSSDWEHVLKDEFACQN